MFVLQGPLQSVKMANAVASYDQLAHQVEALRKENSHLRRELEDNSNHLSKLETETSGMKVSPDSPRLRDVLREQNPSGISLMV